MDKFLKLSWLTIGLNFLILVGAGHGVVPLGFLEISRFVQTSSERQFTSHNSSFSLSAPYEKSLPTAASLSTLGQLILIISILSKGDRKYWLCVAGIVTQWLGYLYLSHGFFDDILFQLSFLSGLPFFIFSILLFRKTLINLRFIKGTY